MADMTYLSNVDVEKVSSLLEETNENTKYFTDITNKTVESYTSHLDDLMKKLYIIIRDKKYTTEDLERYSLELTNLLYFLGDKLETVGIKDDLSEAAKQEIYNKAYLDNQLKDGAKNNKTTVAELKAIAEEASKYEAVVNSIYERSYKIIKYRIDSAVRMIDVLKKIISKHMQDESFSNMTSNGRKILNE